MEFLLLFFFFLLGLCVGSFLNVVIYRLNLPLSQKFRPRQGKTLRVEYPKPEGLGNWRGLVRGRSYCDYCQKQLAWFDNIPLLSFILLRGRCRYCRQPISWQYPAVELTTGLVTVLVFLLSGYGLRVTGYELLISYCLIAIFVSDLRYQIIPDQVIYPAVGATLFYRLFCCSVHLAGVPSPTCEVSFWNYLLTGLGSMGFFLFLYLITRRKGMGLGDVKLAFLMGLLLGWPKILVALYFAFLTGALVGVILILLGKKKFGQQIPFGPFLVGGTFISWFWGEKILSYLSYLGYL